MRKLSFGLNAMLKQEKQEGKGPLKRRELLLKLGKDRSQFDLMGIPETQCEQSILLKRPSVVRFLEANGVWSHEVNTDTRYTPRENILWEEFSEIQHLANGGMSSISSAVFEGKECVIKKGLTTHPNPKIVQLSMSDELTIVRHLKHPNIIKYYGSGKNDEGASFIVLERLVSTLKDEIGLSNASHKCLKTHQEVPLLLAITWALELATGMAYLHDDAIDRCMVLHRDLKPENLGFGEDGRLRIMDLGLALIVDRHFRSRSDTYKMSGNIGSMRYMAPEVANKERYNEKADVHSFGIIFWEMLALEVPYFGMSVSEFKMLVIKGGVRPLLHPSWSKSLCSLLSQCWDPEMNARPSFREIKLQLECILMEEIQTPTVLVEPSESPSLLQKLGKMISKRFGHSQKNAKENNELKSMEGSVRTRSHSISKTRYLTSPDTSQRRSRANTSCDLSDIEPTILPGIRCTTSPKPQMRMSYISDKVRERSQSYGVNADMTQLQESQVETCS